MKFADFTDDIHRPHSCGQWCKTHWYWDFNTQDHAQYPYQAYWKTDNGWARCWVFISPPAYFPKKPTPEQWQAMRMVCPHDPPQLTCNTCRRHEFRALPI